MSQEIMEISNPEAINGWVIVIGGGFATVGGIIWWLRNYINNSNPENIKGMRVSKTPKKKSSKYPKLNSR